MPYLRLVSDLHLEFLYGELDADAAQRAAQRLLPPLGTDESSVLVIAGDLAPICRPRYIINFLRLVQPRFRHVIYVLGNHEFYHGDLRASEGQLLGLLEGAGVDLGALTVAGNHPREVIIDGAHFICGTLWANYLNGSPQAMQAARAYLNDHRLIRDGSGAVTPADLRRTFDLSVERLNEALLGAPNKARTVVVTHHLPSLSAVDPSLMLTREARLLNGAFASDLDELITRHAPAYWCFGHTHVPFSGSVGDTRLLCNPGGYPHERNVATGRFNPNLVVAI